MNRDDHERRSREDQDDQQEREALELYVMGMYDGDVAALERELAEDPAARAIVADEARLDLLLRDAAAAATFCPACDELVRGARCEVCGAAVRPGGYAVDRVLVSNAHGRMYAARDVDGKQVALKELVFVQSPSVEALAAFEREARFLRALDHPAIPRFCASFQEETGVRTRYYLAQELVVGEPLDDRLEEHFFSEAEIAGIARQVLDVLVYLQALSPMVIHRDIKPANLLRRPDGTIAVVDFGAAHVQGMTVGSTAIGTFGYMPLEQLAGEVDATTDLYALGASLLHLLTRREPWRLLQSGLLADADPNVGRRMRTFLATLVAPNPRDRFRSAAEARDALDRLERGRGLRRNRFLGVRWRVPRPVLLAAAGAALMAAGVGGYAVLSETERDHALRALDEARRAAEESRKAAAMMRQLRDEARRLETKVERDHDGVRFEEVQAASDPAEAARDAAASHDPAAVWSGEPGRNDAARVTASAAQTLLSSLTTQMCECTDQRCADAVSRRVTLWGRDMARRLDWSRPEVLNQVADLSQRMTGCLTRLTGAKGDDTALVVPMEPGKTVYLVDGVSNTGIHDAVHTIARSCDLDVVMAGRVAAWLPDKLPATSCDRVLDLVVRRTQLAYETRGAGIVRIARRDELSAEREARAERAKLGIVDDPLPQGRDVDLDFRRIPLRNLLALLAQAGGVDLAQSVPVDATVTVHTQHVPWQRALIEVLAATGMGYRYQESGKHLRIAPLAELDAERPRPPP
jgi:Protein kinase domain